MTNKVFYNDECSLCRIEINHYKKKCTSIEWKKINKISNLSNEINKSPKELIRRLHVKTDNEILIGVDAFIFIWSQIPSYNFLSKVIKTPIIYSLSFYLYEFISLLLYIKNYNQIRKINKL